MLQLVGSYERSEHEQHGHSSRAEDPPALRDRGGGGLAATGPGGLPNPVGVEEASAAQWVGSMQGTAGKSSRCVSGGSTMRGDFRFTVGRGGQLRGFATAVPAHGTISINWAGRDKDDGVPFTAVLANLKKDQRLTGGKLTIPMPFARDAQVTGGRLAVAQGGVKSKDEGVTFESRTYWSAYKIGP